LQNDSALRKRGVQEPFMINSLHQATASMNLADLEIDKLGAKLRYKVRYEVGFACPDIDDLVQETLKRFLDAFQADKIRAPEAAGAFLNGISRNVISEYRRRLFRDVPMPEVPPEPPPKRLPPAELFELREAVADGIRQLSQRDQQVLRAFYLEERPVEEILELTGLTLANFRVVLCRAKEKFRQIYSGDVKSRAVSAH
jgi:RNA polymerase sigma factor (sigma-70 family)